MSVRGIRGATTARTNEANEILSAAKELMLAIVKENHLNPDDVCSVFLTVTPDLDAAFPAKAIRTIPGWELVPLLGSTEIAVPGGLPRCIRLLILVNTDLSSSEVNHVYLREAISLRPDLVHRHTPIDRESHVG
jgi:chorismate mutase